MFQDEKNHKHDVFIQKLDDFLSKFVLESIIFTQQA